MAQQSIDIGGLFRQLSGELVGLSTTLKHHGVSHLVDNFSGNPNEFESWIKSVEKYSFLEEIPTSSIKHVAYQSSKGPVSDFLSRYLPEHPNSTWEEVKKELATRYDIISDPQHALVVLQRTKQGPNEAVQNYAERLLTLAQKAYSATELVLAPIQRQLVSCFVNGLTEEYLQLKLLRKNPESLQAATVEAMAEQNIRARLALRAYHGNPPQSTHEPMEVDHFRSQHKCRHCNRSTHRTSDCRPFPILASNSINAITNPFRTHHPSQPRNVPYTHQRDKPQYNRSFQPTVTSFNTRNQNIVICWRCNKPGHIARECHLPPPPPHRRVSHFSRRDQRPNRPLN